MKWSFLERVERLDKCAEWIAGELSIPRDSVDVQDLDEVSLLFAFNVAGDGFLLWEGEPDLGLYYRRQAYSRYQDFEWTERIFRQALRDSAAEEKRVG